jgi:proteic killer suppression protein
VSVDGDGDGDVAVSVNGQSLDVEGLERAARDRDCLAGQKTRSVEADIVPLPGRRVRETVRRLDMLDSAADLMDLKAPPGNRLEKLKGDRAGRWSIRINDQFRIVFGWNHGNAERVRIDLWHAQREMA